MSLFSPGIPIPRRTLLMAASALLPLSAPRAQSFPSKPIRIVVPFAPGGPTDFMARAVGKSLSQAIGQPVIVDNKPGGGGVIGLGEVLKAPADGHTLAFPSILAVTNPALMANYPYDIVKDFTPLTVVGFIPHALVVRPDSPIKSLGELVAQAKDKPGTVTYASSGNGTSAHLAGAMFADRAGIQVTHVPYRGAGPALQDLLGGQVTFMFVDMSTGLAQIKAGKLRALAIAPARRISALPDVQAIAELGYPGYDIHAWYGLLLKAGTPAPVVQKLYEEVRKVLTSNEIRELFRAQGIDPGGMPPADYGELIRDDLTQWKRVIDKLNIKPD